MIVGIRTQSDCLKAGDLLMVNAHEIITHCETRRAVLSAYQVALVQMYGTLALAWYKRGETAPHGPTPAEAEMEVLVATLHPEGPRDATTTH